MSGAKSWGPSVIHKFDLALGVVNTLPLAPSSGILHIEVQDGTLRLWALRMTDSQGEPVTGSGRRFEVYGTGSRVPGKRLHVGTVMDGSFVWHVFEDVGER